VTFKKAKNGVGEFLDELTNLMSYANDMIKGYNDHVRREKNDKYMWHEK
jgi:hypothetical protein